MRTAQSYLLALAALPYVAWVLGFDADPRRVPQVLVIVLLWLWIPPLWRAAGDRRRSTGQRIGLNMLLVVLGLWSAWVSVSELSTRPISVAHDPEAPQQLVVERTAYRFFPWLTTDVVSTPMAGGLVRRTGIQVRYYDFEPPPPDALRFAWYPDQRALVLRAEDGVPGPEGTADLALLEADDDGTLRVAVQPAGMVRHGGHALAAHREIQAHLNP